MKIIKQEHKGYVEWHNYQLKKAKIERELKSKLKDAPDKLESSLSAIYEMTRYFGRWQYILTNLWGKMSVINIRNFDDKFYWEVGRVYKINPFTMLLRKFKINPVFLWCENLFTKQNDLRKTILELRAFDATHKIAVKVYGRYYTKDEALNRAKKLLTFKSKLRFLING